MASNAENVSIWWRHHEIITNIYGTIWPFKCHNKFKCTIISSTKMHRSCFVPMWALQYASCSRELWINSLYPGDAIWRHGSGPTLAQVMACCLMASNHYLNRCWLIISKVLWHLPSISITGNTQEIYHWRVFQTFLYIITVVFSRGQWVHDNEIEDTVSLLTETS